MKKKKTILELKEAGYEIDPAVLDRIDRKKSRKEMSEIGAKVVSQLEAIVKNKETGLTELSKAVINQINQQVEIVKDLKGAIAKMERPDKWEFDVRRDSKGFINKIYAKGG